MRAPPINAGPLTLTVTPGKVHTGEHPLFCCYAESDDGLNWRKPMLGLHEFQGSKANNIVLASKLLDGANLDAGHPAVFKDENPDAPADARYKALVRSNGAHGLIALQSPDGLNWKPVSNLVQRLSQRPLVRLTASPATVT